MKVDKHLDYDVLNTLKDIMEDDFALLVDTFFQDSNKRLLTLHTLKHPADSDVIRRTAHSFKGSCSNLGALHLADLCSDLEKKALESNFENIAADLRSIDEEFALTKKMLMDYLQ